MAVQALAPYYSTNAEVKAAVDEALACLSAMQNAVGGFGSVQGGSTTSESCAQVVVALTALGIDPATDERFVKNGISVLDALCSYYVEGGGFEHVEGGGVDGMATEQGYYALASYFRFKAGKTALYDMSDVELGAAATQNDIIVDADDRTGTDVGYGIEEVPAADRLTVNVAASVNDDVDDAGELEILWQKEISVAPGTTFPVTITFSVPPEYQNQEVYVYHFNGTAWEVVGKGMGATITVTFNSLSPVALVASTATPATGDAANASLWACLMFLAAAAAVVTVIPRRKRREE